MRYVVIMMVFVTSLDLGLAQAAGVRERESLRELPGVYVLIEATKPDAQADGLSAEAIQTATVHILGASGIRVLTQKEIHDSPEGGVLYVKVSTVKSPVGTYAYSATVELFQETQLVRQPLLGVSGMTWRALGVIGSISQDHLRDVIDSAVQPQVKAFANDFQAVNPR